MKFKSAVIAILALILAINTFTAYKLINEASKQTALIKIIARHEWYELDLKTIYGEYQPSAVDTDEIDQINSIKTIIDNPKSREP